MIFRIERKLKIMLVMLLLTFSSVSVFAVEEYVSDIYRQIDRVFAAKSDVQLNALLSNNKADKYYYLIENYTQKKIRRLIVNNDYDFAMAAILVVIENNLDNEEAVDMYSVIYDAYQVQLVHEEELENQRLAEIERIEKEKEKQKVSAAKEYVSVATKDGGSVYITNKDSKLASYWWKAALGIVDFSYILESSTPVNALSYGISADFDYIYTRDKILWGMDIFGDIRFLGIGSGVNLIPFMFNVEAEAKFGFIKLSRKFFVRAGLATFFVSGTSAESPIQGNMFTPAVGISFDRIQLGNANLNFGVDYYPGHFFIPGMNLALGADANLAIPFAEFDKLKLTVNVGLKDKFFLKASGIENRASLILAIGAENVVK